MPMVGQPLMDSSSCAVLRGWEMDRPGCTAFSLITWSLVHEVPAALQPRPTRGPWGVSQRGTEPCCSGAVAKAPHCQRGAGWERRAARSGDSAWGLGGRAGAGQAGRDTRVPQGRGTRGGP